MTWKSPDLTGRTYAVTGGNAGIGYFISEQLTAAGANVVILARNADRARAAADAIRSQTGKAVAATLPLDLADLDSVATAAAELSRRDRLDGLIHNAGITAGKQRQTTRQGFELVVGTNHLGHFALAAQTMPILAATPGSRVVLVSSFTTKLAKFDPEDLQSEQSYTQQKAYAQSKHAVLLFAFELDRRLRASGVDVRAIAAHPGLGVNALSPARPGINRPPKVRLPLPIQGKDRAARPAVRAATDADALGGQYYGPKLGILGRPVVVSPPQVSRNPELAARLWTQSEQLTGVTFEIPSGER